MAGNTDYTHLITTTFRATRKDWADGVYAANVLLDRFNKNGKVVEMGGDPIVIPVATGKNTTAGFYNKGETLDTEYQQNLSAAKYDWKEAVVSVTMYEREKATNRGKAQIINDLKFKMEEAQASMADILGTAAYNDGSVSKNPHGLQLLIADDVDAGTCGGIDRSDSDNAFFRNYAYTTTVSAWNTSSAGRVAMNDVYANITKDGTVVQGLEIFTTPSVWELIELDISSTDQHYRKSGADVGNMGHPTLQYMGKPIHMDEKCASGKLYFVNMNELYMAVLEGYNMKMRAPKEAEKQNMDIGYIMWFGNFVVRTPKRCGVITTITG